MIKGHQGLKNNIGGVISVVMAILTLLAIGALGKDFVLK